MTRLVRILAVALLAFAAATPAAAQFDVKKKLPKVPGTEKGKPAAAPAATGGGGTLVLDDEVIERIIKGMRAAKAYREDAAKANTPYGRHLQAKAAYAEAKPKCDAGSATFATRCYTRSCCSAPGRCCSRSRPSRATSARSRSSRPA